MIFRTVSRVLPVDEGNSDLSMCCSGSILSVGRFLVEIWVVLWQLKLVFHSIALLRTRLTSRGVSYDYSD